MTPQGGTALKRIAGLRKQPGKNYRMLLESNRVVGTCDGKEAMKQVARDRGCSKRDVYQQLLEQEE